MADENESPEMAQIDEEGSVESDSEPDEIEKTDLERFYERLAYNIPPPPKTSKRTAQLAQPTQHHLTGLYDQYKDVLSPTGRKKRIERKVMLLNAMTTEELEKIVKKREEDKLKQAKLAKKKADVYRSLLHKLEIKCREKFISDVYEKYANYIARNPTILEGQTEVYPENVQRVIDYILYNLLSSLKIRPESRQTDRTLYQCVATIITMSILDILYAAQTEDEKSTEEEQFEPTKKTVLPYDNIKKRAMLGAENKLSMSAKRKKVTSKTFEQIMELCKTGGCR